MRQDKITRLSFPSPMSRSRLLQYCGREIRLDITEVALEKRDGTDIQQAGRCLKRRQSYPTPTPTAPRLCVAGRIIPRRPLLYGVRPWGPIWRGVYCTRILCQSTRTTIPASCDHHLGRSTRIPHLSNWPGHCARVGSPHRLCTKPRFRIVSRALVSGFGSPRRWHTRILRLTTRQPARYIRIWCHQRRHCPTSFSTTQ
jgi:hypothetical protein